MRRAYTRHLLTTEQINTVKPLLDTLAPKLNAYRNAILKKTRQPPPPNNQ